MKLLKFFTLFKSSRSTIQVENCNSNLRFAWMKMIMVNSGLQGLRGYSLNPLSPHDALKHHFTSLKTYLIFLQLRVSEDKFPRNCSTNNMVIFFNLSPTSSHLYPLQAENCDSNSRLAVNEDDTVKSGLKGLNIQFEISTHLSKNENFQ